jgi:hypothetical protein
MKKRFLFIALSIILILFLERCTDKGNTLQNSNSKFDIALIAYDINTVKRFNDIFDNSKILYLRTPNNLLIASIDKILLYQGKFFILDRKFSTLLSFDRSGNFLIQYGKIGLSKNEFKAIQDFDIDSSKKQLVIFSNENQSLYYYQLNDGRFIKTEYIGLYASCFAILPLNQKMFYVGYRLNPKIKGYNIVVLDSSRHIVNKFLPFNLELSSYGWKFSGFVNKTNNGIFFTDAFNDSIFSYLKGTFSLYCYIDINSKTIQKIRLDHKQILNSGIILDTTTSFLKDNFLCNNNYIICGYQKGKRTKTAIYKIKDNSIVILTAKNQDDPLLILAKRSLYLSNNDTLIFSIAPEDITNMKSKNLKLFEKLPTNIKKTIINTDSASNYYLLIAKLKH